LILKVNEGEKSVSGEIIFCKEDDRASDNIFDLIIQSYLNYYNPN